MHIVLYWAFWGTGKKEEENFAYHPGILPPSEGHKTFTNLGNFFFSQHSSTLH